MAAIPRFSRAVIGLSAGGTAGDSVDGFAEAGVSASAGWLAWFCTISIRGRLERRLSYGTDDAEIVAPSSIARSNDTTKRGRVLALLTAAR